MSNEVFNFELDSPWEEQIDFLTLVSESEAGKEQRYQKWLKPRRTWRLKLSSRNATQMSQIWRFYVARKGSYDTFLFQNPNESPVTAERFGSGDGVKSVFYLGPSVDIGSGDLILVDNSEAITRSVGGTGDFLSFSTYTMEDSFGQLTTNAPLPSGDVLRANYSFYYRVRFKDDNLSREAFAYQLWNAGVDLLEVI